MSERSHVVGTLARGSRQADPLDLECRSQAARAARFHVRRNFDWESIGEKQRELLRRTVGDP